MPLLLERAIALRRIDVLVEPKLRGPEHGSVRRVLAHVGHDAVAHEAVAVRERVVGAFGVYCERGVGVGEVVVQERVGGVGARWVVEADGEADAGGRGVEEVVVVGEVAQDAAVGVGGVG